MTDDPLSVPYRERERSVTMEPMGADDELHEELFTLNIGLTTRPRTGCCAC